MCLKNIVICVKNELSYMFWKGFYMKLDLRLILVGVLAFTLGLSANNYAVSQENAKLKIGIVDIPQVVSSSAQVEALKKEQIKKAEDFKLFIDKAKLDVQKQTSDEKRKELAAKYEKEISARQAAETKEYAKKLSELDKNISDTIAKKAKEQGYDMVFAKGTILYGGEDITSMISKAVK